MGGLLIKQALINAHNSTKLEYNLIKDDTTGLAFFATPHRGGNSTEVALGNILATIAIGLGFKQGDNVLKTLKSEGTFSEIMYSQWKNRMPDYDILSFWGTNDNVSRPAQHQVCVAAHRISTYQGTAQSSD
jgi:hypothetical protein